MTVFMDTGFDTPCFSSWETRFALETVTILSKNPSKFRPRNKYAFFLI